jgi:predicted dehydrogenase
MGSPRTIEGAPGAAVIGGGFIGPVHVEALRRIGAEVVGLLGRSPERTADLARRLGIGRVYRDLGELVDDPRVGVVHIASPNAHHFEQARSVMESGRHVICEKPLATSSEESAVLRALARSRPEQAAAVNYNVRYYPLCHEIRERIASGALGRVLSVTGSYVQDWLLYPEDFNWRVEPDGRTNLRAVADIGTHWMDLAQYLIGMPIRAVNADLATFHPRRFRTVGPTDTFSGATGATGARPTEVVEVRTDDHGAVLLRFDAGVRGAFHVSQVTAGRKNRLTIEIAATDAAVAWDSESPNQLWIGSRRGPNQLLERDPALLHPAAAAISHYPGGHAEGFPDTFKQLYLDVYGWIVEGRKVGRKPTFPTFADGDWEVGLCEAIARSAAESRWVSIHEVRLHTEDALPPTASASRSEAGDAESTKNGG